MAWTANLDVDIGDYTKASDYDLLADNADYLQTLADVGHDFDISTGTGYHRGLYSNPVIFKASASVFGSLWLDDTDPTNIEWRTLTGASAIAVTPAAKTDGKIIQLATRISNPL